MVYKFFDIKSSDGAGTQTNKSAIKSEIMPNRQLRLRKAINFTKDQWNHGYRIMT